VCSEVLGLCLSYLTALCEHTDALPTVFQRRSIGLNESLDLIERHALEVVHDSTRTDID
jgi:hypothetical protein